MIEDFSLIPVLYIHHAANTFAFLTALQVESLVSDIQWHLCVPAFVFRWEDKGDRAGLISHLNKWEEVQPYGHFMVLCACAWMQFS